MPFLKQIIPLLACMLPALVRPDNPMDAAKLIESWIQEQDKKLPSPLQKFFSQPYECKTEHEVKVTPGMTDLAPAALQGKGVAMDYSWGKDTAPDRIFSAKTLTLNGRELLITEYGEPEGEEIYGLYIRESSGYKEITQLAGCCHINAIKLGPKGPELLSTYASGCGSGGGGSLYAIGQAGAREVLTWGGWRAGIRFTDIDGDGIYEVLYGSASGSYPDGLEKRLRKVKGYQDEWIGPKWVVETIQKWDGKTFQCLGERQVEYEN